MQQFGSYQLIRQIAVGGMAEVFLAKVVGVEDFEKFVALKMIHPHLAMNTEFVRMLINEAKIAAQLSHTNIAQTLDLGCVDGRYFIAMEYVDGVDVSRLIRAAAHTGTLLPIDVCALILREVAGALDHAHCKHDDGGRLLGIIHRDVSPDNVLITYDGEVKLVDFGIAKATAASHLEVETIKGKWHYMSPEQTRGEPLDATSDIYSAGAVLWEMLTGRMLFEDQELEQLVALIRTGTFPRPSQLRTEVSSQLERIVLRALSTNRWDRYQTAEELAGDLQRFLQGYSPQTGTAQVGAVVTAVAERAGLITREPPLREPAPPATPGPRSRTSTLLGMGAEPAATTSRPSGRLSQPVIERGDDEPEIEISGDTITTREDLGSGDV